METSRETIEALRNLLPLMAVLVVGGAGAFAYLGILAFTHVKARLILEFHREIGRQIQKDQDLAKTGGEVPHLARFQELHGMLRELLEREGVLKKAAPKK